MRRSLLLLYREMVDADDRYRAELERVYGKRAPEARYYRQHDDAEVEAAGQAYVRASDAWRDEYRFALTEAAQ